MRAIPALLAIAVAATAQTVPPKVILRIDPSYSAEASRAKVNATLTVGLVVDTNGIPKNVRILRGAGFGLDAKAVEAVNKWRFEPASKAGSPLDFPSTIEVNLRLMDFDGVLSRLTFSPLQSAPPELVEGRVPRLGSRQVGEPGSSQAGDKVRAEFDVATNGRVSGVAVPGTNASRAGEIANQLRTWRFTPVAQPLHAVLELETVSAGRSTPIPVKTASPFTYTMIDPRSPQDLKLGPPIPVAPADQAEFNTYPRTTQCSWQAVPGATSYLLQWDYFDDGWHAEKTKMGEFGTMVTGTELSFDFVGAQPGRWRVWPFNAKGERGVPSEWRVFRYSR